MKTLILILLAIEFLSKSGRKCYLSGVKKETNNFNCNNTIFR